MGSQRPWEKFADEFCREAQRLDACKCFQKSLFFVHSEERLAVSMPEEEREKKMSWHQI